MSYAKTVARPVVPVVAGGTQSLPAPVSTVTGSGIIDANLKQNALHNATVLQASNRKVTGGSKHKRTKRTKRFKRSDHKKRTKRTKRTKRSKRTKRTKRTKRSKRGGGDPTSTPTPKPSLVPVPQFTGGHNAGANANSLIGNKVLMMAGSQSVYDNPNAPPTNTVLNS